MQLSAMLAAGLLLAGAPLPASAAVNCTIGVGTAGVLKLSSDAKQLGSQVGGGVASVVTISQITGALISTTIRISNARLDAYPAGFSAGAATVKTAYDASWLLGLGSSITHNYDDPATSSFVVPIVANLAITITMNTKIDDATGFKQGDYTAKTTVECL